MSTCIEQTWMKMILFTLLVASVSRALAWSSRSSFALRPLPLTPYRAPRQLHGSHLQMGMKVKIRIVGRKNGSEKWLEDAYKLYETRLRPSPLEVETVWHKHDQDLIRGVQIDKRKNHVVVLLDPKGKQKTSEKFSESLYQWLDRGGSRMSFVIGGAEGLPSELREESVVMLSLSDMTFTHQFARILLIEQIYRAAEIRKGSGYHK